MQPMCLMNCFCFFTCSKTYMNCVELFRESLLVRVGLTCVIHWPMNPHYTQHKSLFHCLWHRSIIHSLAIQIWWCCARFGKQLI
jgi:hypothetical protein